MGAGVAAGSLLVGATGAAAPDGSDSAPAAVASGDATRRTSAAAVPLAAVLADGGGLRLRGDGVRRSDGRRSRRPARAGGAAGSFGQHGGGGRVRPRARRARGAAAIDPRGRRRSRRRCARTAPCRVADRASAFSRICPRRQAPGRSTSRRSRATTASPRDRGLDADRRRRRRCPTVGALTVVGEPSRQPRAGRGRGRRCLAVAGGRVARHRRQLRGPFPHRDARFRGRGPSRRRGRARPWRARRPVRRGGAR